MRITDLPQYRRSAKRFAEIVKVLGRYGLAGFVRQRDPEFIKKLFETSEGERLTDMPVGVRLRMAFTDLGPTFVKLGQMLSTRPDVVGHDVAEELSKLQSGTPPDPPEQVLERIQEELGHPADEAFAEFDAEAFASASIGQAHSALLHDGTRVVVKVRHPGIEDKIREDMDILSALAALAERYDEQAAQFQPRAAVEEFRRSITRELDFGREGRSLELFARNFEGDDRLHVPRYYLDQSSRRVLTMERLEGYSIAERDRLVADGYDRKALAVAGANIYLEMIFRDGVYHADPHPGNIFVLPGGVFGLLDFGMIGRIDSELQENLEGALMSISERDSEELTRVVVRLGSVPPGLDRAGLRADIEDFIGEYATSDISRMNLSAALNDLIAIIRHHHILLAGNVSMLLRVLIMLEGTSRSLDPSFSLAEILIPYPHKVARRRFGPKALLHEARRRTRAWARLIDRAPGDISDVLARLSDGRFDVNLEHRRLDPSINKLVLGILSAALFLGSSIVLANRVPPILFDISVFGALGSGFAVFLGFRLVRAIHRSSDLG